MADKTEASTNATAPAATPGKPAEAPKAAPTAAARSDSGKSEPSKSEPVKSVSTPAPVAKPAAAKPTSPVAAKPAPVAAKPAPKPVAAPKAAAVQAPKIKSAPVAKAEKPQPIEVAAPKRGRPPKAISQPKPISRPETTSTSKPVPIVAQKATPAPAVAITEGSKTMNETVAKAQETAKNFTNEASARTQALFGEMTERAKTSYEKGVKLAEEMTEFSKGNVEAFVESSKVAAKGVETMGQEAADYARKAIENSTAAFKTFASAKSPTEFFKLQSDYAKSYFDNAVAESSKVTEAWLKLAGDVAQPLSNRYAVAVEKIKLANA